MISLLDVNNLPFNVWSKKVWKFIDFLKKIFMYMVWNIGGSDIFLAAALKE